ncbi:MAG: transcriptional regulator, SarA/Rot family [Bacillota bacterium]
MSVYYNEIYEMFHKIFEKIISNKYFNQINKEYNLEFIDYLFLKNIKKLDDCNLSSLYKCLDINYDQVSRKVDKLKQLDFIDKKISKKDKRKKNLVLTKKGKDVFKEIDRLMNKYVKFIIKDFTVNEEKAVLKFLSKISQITYVDIEKDKK